MQRAFLVLHRTPLLATLLATLLAAVLLFGRSPQPAVISGWSGEVAAAPVSTPAAAPAASDASTGAAEQQRAPALAAAPQPTNQPWGNPFGSAPTVLTQGYGVGSHAPAASKGGIDLGLDPDSDGHGNPEATLGAPLYATMRGVVQLHPESWPGGNHVWIKNDQYKVGYAHLLAYAVADGQVVERGGDLVGYAGSTGRSTGPHLHYHIWHDGVNVNPLHYGALP